MSGRTKEDGSPSGNFALDRRNLLRGLALSGAAVTGITPSKAEIWEEGDTQCRPAIQEVVPEYPIDDSLLVDFINVSEALTGVKPLDQRLGSQYLDRYAHHPELTKLLPALIKAYRDFNAGHPQQSQAQDSQARFNESVLGNGATALAAEQLIYLWYVSAFFLPADHSAASRNWIYGTPEQYDRALLWTVAHAHAPMTRGGPNGHWARPPVLRT
jgi:Membrane bound FAD containing D-sorbitol dehydrogenase